MHVKSTSKDTSRGANMGLDAYVPSLTGKGKRKPANLSSAQSDLDYRRSYTQGVLNAGWEGLAVFLRPGFAPAVPCPLVPAEIALVFFHSGTRCGNLLSWGFGASFSFPAWLHSWHFAPSFLCTVVLAPHLSAILRPCQPSQPALAGRAPRSQPLSLDDHTRLF